MVHDYFKITYTVEWFTVRLSIFIKNVIGSISCSPFLSQGLVCCGSGEPGVDEHRSFVLYHSNSPRWAEQIKLPIPLEMFHGTHLRFELRHCSSKTPLHLHFFLENWFLHLLAIPSSEILDFAIIDSFHITTVASVHAAKEKGEKKLFGFSFVPLMQDDGRPLPDGTHELIVHKVLSLCVSVCLYELYESSYYIYRLCVLPELTKEKALCNYWMGYLLQIMFGDGKNVPIYHR